MKHSILHFMRQATLASILATAPLVVVSAQGKSVVMLAKDGSSYELALDKVSRIDFNSTEVMLTSKGGDVKSMPYTDVGKILIGADNAGLTELIAKGEIAVWPSVTTGPISISGAATGTKVHIYDQKGMLVQSAEAADETLELDISKASPGVVIVRIGDHSVKIIKK